MDNEEIFTTSFQAGRKRIYVDVKENHAGKVQMSRTNSSRSQGWGLVEFASAAEVEYAISQCDGLDLDGREIRVRADKGSGTGPKGHAAKDVMARMPAKTRRNVADKVVDPHRVFVMNLNFETTEEELADHCASSGEVASVELLTRGRAQRPSGSAVVEYRYAEAAAAAVDALEGTELDGRDLRVRAYFSN